MSVCIAVPALRNCRAALAGMVWVSLLTVTSTGAAADPLVEPGQRARLTVNVTVVGSVEAPQGSRDEVVRWSTRRSFDATVEMVAEEPEQLSMRAAVTGDTSEQPQVYADMARQVETSGEDPLCLMQLAMQMVG